MYSHKYKCTDNKKISTASWYGEILTASFTKSMLEADVNSRGSYFQIIMGHYSKGNYLCVPNWNIGIELAGFNDHYWTLEKLTQKYPSLNRVDAISITYAVAELALLAGM